MTFIDHVLDQVGVPAARAWLRNRPAPLKTAPPAEPVIPSFASVEYELSQIRVSLRGFVDFGDERSRQA